MNTRIVTSEFASKAIAVGRKHHMRFKVVGFGDVPHEPYYKDEWWFDPLISESTIPKDALDRLEIIRQAGIRVKGIILAHEAPRILGAPGPMKEPKTAQNTKTNDNVGYDVLPTLKTVVGVLAGVLGAALAVAGIFFIVAIRLDPALIVVLEDGTHLEVMTWYE